MYLGIILNFFELCLCAVQSKTKVELLARLCINLAINVNAIFYVIEKCIVNNFDNLWHDSILIIFINTSDTPANLSERLFSAKRWLGENQCIETFDIQAFTAFSIRADDDFLIGVRVDRTMNRCNVVLTISLL